MAGDIDTVPERIGADQRGPRIVAEDVDQGTRVDRIDMGSFIALYGIENSRKLIAEALARG